MNTQPTSAYTLKQACVFIADKPGVSYPRDVEQFFSILDPDITASTLVEAIHLGLQQTCPDLTFELLFSSLRHLNEKSTLLLLLQQYKNAENLNTKQLFLEALIAQNDPRLLLYVNSLALSAPPQHLLLLLHFLFDCFYHRANYLQTLDQTEMVTAHINLKQFLNSVTSKECQLYIDKLDQEAKNVTLEEIHHLRHLQSG
jgi:hypothetical protein